MSLITQKLTNKFPFYYRIRKDRSGFGSRFVSCFADAIQDSDKQDQIIANNLLLNTYLFPHEVLYSQTITPLEKENGLYVYPTVVGDGNNLELKTSVGEFFYSYSNELELLEEFDIFSIILWQSSTPNTYISIDVPQRLFVIVQGSTDYNQASNLEDNSKPQLQYIYIEGFDDNYNFVKESINVIDDDIYRTVNIYSELTKVIYQGFDGEVIISPAYSAASYKLSFLNKITIDDINSQLYYYLENDKLYLGGRAFTTEGQAYRDVSLNVEDFTLCLVASLFDSEDSVLSNCLDVLEYPLTGDLAVLTDTHIHFYECNIPEFIASGVQPSYEEYLLLENDIPYVEYNTLGKWWTKLKIDPSKVEWLSIKIVSPTGIEEYLQLDKTWGVGEARFSPVTIGNVVKWSDFQFTKTLNEYGQWNVIATLGRGRSTYISVVSSIVPKLTAINSVLHNVDSASGFFVDKGGKINIYTDSKVFVLNFVKHLYSIDEDTGTIYTCRNYSSLETSYG